MRKRLKLEIFGDVQGVGYRFAACRHAKLLGLVGWVRNLPQGTVQLVAEGERESLQAFLEWCYTGVSYARVERIGVDWQAARGDLESFSIVG